jgi:hypothetical protein
MIVRAALILAFGYVVVRVRVRILRGPVIEMLVKMLMLLMQAIVTISSSPTMRGTQICLAGSLGMDRAS